jgi:hypothetical protein
MNPMSIGIELFLAGPIVVEVTWGSAIWSPTPANPQVPSVMLCPPLCTPAAELQVRIELVAVRDAAPESSTAGPVVRGLRVDERTALVPPPDRMPATV